MTPNLVNNSGTLYIEIAMTRIAETMVVIMVRREGLVITVTGGLLLASPLLASFAFLISMRVSSSCFSVSSSIRFWRC